MLHNLTADLEYNRWEQFIGEANVTTAELTRRLDVIEGVRENRLAPVSVTPLQHWNLIATEAQHQDFHRRMIQLLKGFRNEPTSNVTLLQTLVTPVLVQRQESTVSQLPE